MRYLLPTSLACALALGSTSAVAQTVPGPGIHVVTLRTSSTGAKQVQSTTLLETPHLKLVRIVIPKSGVLPAHSVVGQVSIQAVSGSGELRMGARTERLDATHAVVLAPGAEHEVRADAHGDLVLLIHQVVGPPMGRGMGGRGQGMGPGPWMGDPRPSGVTPPSETPAPKK